MTHTSNGKRIPPHELNFRHLLCRKILNAITEQKLSTAQIVKRTGCYWDRQNLWRLREGILAENWSAKKLASFAQALGVQVAWIVDGEIIPIDQKAA